MPKSKIKLLREALERGDAEEAKRLASEIEVAARKPRPARKKATARTTPTTPVAAEIESIEVGDLVAHPDDGWLAPSRASVPGRSLNAERGLVEARHESMKGREFNNDFDHWVRGQGDGVGGMPPKHRDADKKIARSALTPRPGTPGARRDVARKVPVHCDGCGREFQVYPSEMMVVDSEPVYKCDRCIVRGK